MPLAQWHAVHSWPLHGATNGTSGVRVPAPSALQGVTLHALIDSCHSGTVMNLPFNAVLRHGQFEDWHEEYKGRSRSWQKVRSSADKRLVLVANQAQSCGALGADSIDGAVPGRCASSADDSWRLGGTVQRRSA